MFDSYDYEDEYVYTGNEEAWYIQDMRYADPDAQSFQPTQLDYEAFEEWAVRTFGQAAYDHYMGL